MTLSYDHLPSPVANLFRCSATELSKMAENLKKVPKRGILKASTSFEQRELEHSMPAKNPHFDEQNLLETLHPADKDYGFMKIDEPKTPYEYAPVVEEEEGGDGEAGEAPKRDELDAQLLAERIAAEAEKPRRFSEPSGDAEDLKLLSPEQREARNNFEQKRKSHYNEFQAVKMARQLMVEDDEDDEDEETSGGGGEEAAAAKAAEAMDTAEAGGSEKV